MKLIWRITIGMTAGLVVYWLVTYRTDRLYKIAEPIEGQEQGVILDAQRHYGQSVVYGRRNVTRVGLYLRAVTNELPSGKISLRVKQNGRILAENKIESVVIDNEGATRWRFNPPLGIDANQNIELEIKMDETLSGMVRAQKSSNDHGDDYKFMVDGKRQDDYLAMDIYDAFRPPLAYQLGIILLAATVVWVARIKIYGRAGTFISLAVLVLLYVLPSLAAQRWPMELLVTFVIALSGMYWLLQQRQLPWPAVMLGAQAFAFTTWWPLQLSSGRGKILAIACLPYLVMLIFYRQRLSTKEKKTAVMVSILFIVSAIAVFSWQEQKTIPLVAAGWRDIFLDPNQTPNAFKVGDPYLSLQMPKGDPATIVTQGGWHHFGSYVGLINLILAFIGIPFYGKKNWVVLLIGVASVIVAASPLTSHLVSITPLPPQYAIIGATFALSFFAAGGLVKVWAFLGQSRLVSFIIYCILLFALLDLMNVVNKTNQFNWL